MPKVLVLAYQISPNRGSEYSVAWNYISHMSRDNELTVLYGTSGNHMGDFEEFDQQISNVRFVPIKPNFFANTLNILNRKKWFPYAFYFAYYIWHWQAYKEAIQITKIEKFDLIHFLNPIGFREPGFLWKIKLPYIWGPISGTINRPPQLFKGLSNKDKLIFEIRNCINTFQFKHNSRFKKALIRTDLLLTATTENQLKIKEYYRKESLYIPENGIPESLINNSIKKKTIQNKHINILWIGRIDSGKSLNILLYSLANISTMNWFLHVIGDGPKKSNMATLSEILKIDDKIKWHGQKQRSEVLELIKIGHLHVITSLGEGNPTTLWETMAYGIPTISLDHCGMHDTICENCGIKIPIISYEQVIQDLSEHLKELIEKPQIIDILSIGSLSCSKKYLWENRINFFNKAYEIAISNYSNYSKQDV